MAHCNISTQFYEKMLGNVRQYMDSMQYQSPKWYTSNFVPTYKGMKKEYRFTNNEYEIGIAIMTLSAM